MYYDEVEGRILQLDLATSFYIELYAILKKIHYLWEETTEQKNNQY